MKVYLADLYHSYHLGKNPDTAPCTVPLGIAFLAAAARPLHPDVQFTLFRYPDPLLDAIAQDPPDLLGFSLCSWNSDVSWRCFGEAKAQCPDLPVVFGGPCVDDTDPQIAALLQKATAADFAVPGEGEVGFVQLVSAIKRGAARADVIPGVAYLGQTGQLVRGKYIQPAVPLSKDARDRQGSKLALTTDSSLAIEIQSPYLDGWLDPFLDEGMVPIVQTMRGCPYRCHFCVSGTTSWDQMKGFPEDRVKAEIDYALSRSKAKDLILTDENWGVLGERDVKIARFLIERYHEKQSPARLYYYTAKIVNDASRQIAEMVAPIAWIGELSMSFQSLNPETRNAIKRTNISLEKLGMNNEWAKQRNIITSSEMIYGFPYETPDTFISGVETLMNAGMGKVQIYPLQLFSGIDLDSPEVREKFGFKTMFRLSDSGYGVYQHGRMVSTETEEIVVATRWSDFDGYLTIRRYAFFLMALFGREYLVELARLCDEATVHSSSILRHLTLADYAQQPALRRIMADYNRDAEAELQPSREAVHALVAPRLLRGEDVSGVKLNLIYLGRIFSSRDAVAELLGMIECHFETLLAGNPNRDVVMTYVREILPNRVVELNARVEPTVAFHSRFNYARWSAKDYGSLADLLLSRPERYTGTAGPMLIENLSRFDPAKTADLQAVYERTRSRYFLRSVNTGVESLPLQ